MEYFHGSAAEETLPCEEYFCSPLKFALHISCWPESSLLFSLGFATNYLRISIIFGEKGEFVTVLLLFSFSFGFLAPQSCCGWVSLPFCRLKSVQISFDSLFLCQAFICSLQQCETWFNICILPNTITLLAYFKIVRFKTAASDFKPCPP